MRVFLIGQRSLGVSVYQGLLERDHNIVGVSAPIGDRLWSMAGLDGLPVMNKCKMSCDLIVMAHVHRYVDAAERAMASIGALSFHPSLLPRHRGRDAVKWTIYMGELCTGGTVYWVDDGWDTGPVFMQEEIRRLPEDDHKSLWRCMFPMAVEMLVTAADRVRSGDRTAVAQLEEDATYEPMMGG